MTSPRTAAATRARVTGGREDGLLHLFTLWRQGATIAAGTACCPPRRIGFRVGIDCAVTDCRTTVFGDCDVEAIDRLAEHRRTCHG